MGSVKVKEQNASFALFLSVFAGDIESILRFHKIEIKDLQAVAETLL